MAVDPRVVLANTAHWSLTGSHANPCHVPDEHLAVVVTARFADGTVAPGRGHAMAWTEQAVHVYFLHPNPRLQGGYRVWLPVDDATSDLSLLEDDDHSSAISSDS